MFDSDSLANGARCRALFEQSSLGVVEFDAQGHILQANDGFCALLGRYGAESLAGLSWRSAVHPDDWPSTERALLRILEDGLPFERELRYVRADGAAVWAWNAVSGIRDESGKVRALLSINRSLAESKRAEEMSEVCRSRLRAVLDAMSDACLVADGQGAILQFNRAAEKLFDCAAADALGVAFGAFLPETALPGQGMGDRTLALVGGESGEREVRVCVGRRGDGDSFPVEIAVLRYAEAGEARFVATVRDIGERLGAEAALQERLDLRERLAKVAATAPGTICSFKLRPDGSACMPYASAAFEHTHGFKPEEAREDFAPVFRRVHPDDADSLGRSIAESARAMSPWRATFRYLHPARGEIWLEGHSMPQREPDGSILWHGYVQDITERMDKEREIGLLNRRLQYRLDEMRTVFDTVPIGVAIAEDPQGWHIRGNRALERLYGLPHGAEFSKRMQGAADFRAFRGERELSVDELPMQRAVRGATIQGEIFEIRVSDGTTQSILCHAAPLFDEFGCPRGAVGAFLNISPLVETERKLAASERRWRQLAEAMPNLVWSSDAAGNWNYLSRQWIEYTGIGEAEQAGDDWLAQIHADDRASLASAWRRSVESGQMFHAEFRIRRHDGEYRWFKSRALPRRDDAGQILGWYGASTDIQDLRETQAALLSGERFRQVVLDALPASIALLDANGTIIGVNRLWLRFAEENGRPDVAAVGVGVNYLHVCRRSLLDGDASAGAALKGIESVLSGERNYFELEYPCESEAGKSWFAMQAVRPAAGIDGALVVHLDISERKRAEMLLRDSEERLRLALEAANAGLWDREIRTGQTYFSPEWKRQLGYGQDELPGLWRTWEDLLHPDDRERALSLTEDFLADRVPHYDLEYRLRHKNGSYRWIHSRGALLDDPQGNPGRMLGLSLDITLNKQAQNRRERRVKMEDLFMQSVALQTAAAIAHELNQPLAAIASYAEAALLLSRGGGAQAERLDGILERIARQAERAGQTMRQLLGLLRKGDAETEPVDLNEAVHGALELIETDARFPEFEIVADLDPALPKVVANRLQIEKVLLNLVRNGQEAMREAGVRRGAIVVETRRAEVSPAMARLSVRDGGNGLAGMTPNEIFQPFYTTKPSGLGMGLAISRALIEAHGGKLWGESNPEGGMNFHFTLPFVS